MTYYVYVIPTNNIEDVGFQEWYGKKISLNVYLQNKEKALCFHDDSIWGTISGHGEILKTIFKIRAPYQISCRLNSEPYTQISF